MAGSSRGNPKLSDIVRSVLVLGLGVVLVWGAAQIFTVTPDEPPVPDVDYTSVLAGVEREAGFVPVAPASLPDGWQATSARFRDQAWFLGVLTGDERFVGLTQAPEDEDDLVAERAEGSEPEGEVQVGGATWTRWTSSDGATYSQTRDDGTAVVVTSDLPRDVLETYVASLVAEPSPAAS